jgi:hypothetical protein
VRAFFHEWSYEIEDAAAGKRDEDDVPDGLEDD